MLLLVVAAAGLIGVFVLIAGYVSDVSKQVGPKVEILELRAPVAPYQPITASMLAEVTVPAKWAPVRSLRDPSQAVGLVTDVPLPGGTYLEQGMLTTPPALQPGEREIAILVDAESGVAGQVSPGSQVDIIATFSGANQGPSSARVIVPDARVLDVGTPTVAGGSATGSSAPSGQNQVVPVTFALTPTKSWRSATRRASRRRFASRSWRRAPARPPCRPRTSPACDPLRTGSQRQPPGGPSLGIGRRKR